jgi:UDP-N-acetylglucosamine pyrophosphorylase
MEEINQTLFYMLIKAFFSFAFLETNNLLFDIVDLKFVMQSDSESTPLIESRRAVMIAASLGFTNKNKTNLISFKTFNGFLSCTPKKKLF